MDNHIRQTFTNQIWMNNLSINWNDIKLLWLPLLASKLPLTSQKHFALCACKCLKCLPNVMGSGSTRLDATHLYSKWYQLFYLPFPLPVNIVVAFRMGSYQPYPTCACGFLPLLAVRELITWDPKAIGLPPKLARSWILLVSEWFFYFSTLFRVDICTHFSCVGAKNRHLFWWFLSFNETYLDKQICSIG